MDRGVEKAIEQHDKLCESAECWRARAEVALARVAELERRAKLTIGSLPCGGCGGPHRFDTSVPSVVWNEVIRAKGLSDYLCTSCILEQFVLSRQSFTATLWNENLHGVAVEFNINSTPAQDANRIQDENNVLRAKAHAVAHEEFERLYGKVVQRISADLAGDFDAALDQLEYNRAIRTLEAAAKVLCRACNDEKRPRRMGVRGGPGDWSGTFRHGATSGYCKASTVWDMVEKMEYSGGLP